MKSINPKEMSDECSILLTFENYLKSKMYKPKNIIKDGNIGIPLGNACIRIPRCHQKDK